MLPGLEDFCSVRGLVLGADCFSISLLEPTRSTGLGGLEEDCEKKETGRSLFIFLDTGGAVSGTVSCIGVKEEREGLKTLRLFRRRLSDIAAGGGAKTCLAIEDGRISALKALQAGRGSNIFEKHCMRLFMS